MIYIYKIIYIEIVLVGDLEHGWILTFHSVGNFIIPTDELIFFRGVETTNQLYMQIVPLHGHPS